ncbi:MAG: hypothetical protein KDC98_07250, partial [Planctomycetes bacterium]|nr:hypothetical protein [Planctomycetota bacterium]
MEGKTRMSLFWKLVLGFLFALVLQVAQIVTVGYFTAKMQEASATVSSALQANITVQRSIDVLRDLQGRVAKNGVSELARKLPVYAVFVEELESQSRMLVAVLGAYGPDQAGRVAQSAAQVKAQFAELGEALGGGVAEQEVADLLAFLDDELDGLLQALLQAQTLLGQIGDLGVEREREVHDLPFQAGIAITVIGVVLLTIFVAWFSRQLVVPIERA